jgi:ABC-2 type transport system permease protein
VSPRRIVWLTARREIRTRMAVRSYRLGTALMVVAIVALIVVIDVVGGGGSAQRVGLSGDAAQLAAPVRATAATLGEEVETEEVGDAGAGEAQVRDGTLDALVAPAPNGLRVVVDESLDDALRATLTAVAREQALDAEITTLGGDPADIDRRLAGVQLEVRALDPEAEHAGERIAIGIFVGVLVYVALLVYGQIVAQGVVEEKVSRVVELLLSTIRAWELMAGKVLGIGVVAIAQLLVLLLAGTVAGLATGVLSLPASVAAETVVWSVVWFLLGFFLYALLFAAAGALVSRQEEVGGVTGPLIVAIVFPYVIGASVLPADPGNGFVAVLSLIPFFAPMLMPMRLAIGPVPAVELAVAIILTVVSILALVRLTGRIYANAVRRTGARIAIRDALRPS